MARRPPAKRRDINNLADLRGGLYCRVSLDKDGTEKSVDDQEAVGHEWADRTGVRVEERHVYRDADRSASRFATKQREDFNRLLRDIEAGELDVVWFWELSRSQRRLDVFAKLRDLCRNMGVLWVIRDRVYDPSNYADMMTLGMLSVIGENESEMTSLRVERGKRSSAQAGRRAGKVPYGYKPRYDPEGRYLGDVPNVFDDDGRPMEDSPAYVVKEIYDRIAAGHSITSIRRDLNDRGLYTQQGHPWENSKIRYVAMSPTYLGQRVYQVEQHCEQKAGDRTKAVLEDVNAGWPRLVDPETWWAVQRILNDPARMTTRPGARTRRHLLSSVARCAVCGGKLLWKMQARNAQHPEPRVIYFCKDKSCVGIMAQPLNEYVEKVMVRWLSDPDVAADLTGDPDSTAAALARADAEQGRAQLQQLDADVKAGVVSARIATIEERRLLEVIGEAERRVKAATLPPILVDLIGPQAKAGWDALNVDEKRLIVQTVAEIRVRPVGRGHGGKIPIQDRVDWRPLLGPGVDGDR